MPPTPSPPSRHEASGLRRSLGVPTRSLQLPSFSPQPVVSDPSGPGLSRSVPRQPHPSARSLGSQCPKRPGPRPRPTDSHNPISRPLPWSKPGVSASPAPLRMPSPVTLTQAGRQRLLVGPHGPLDLPHSGDQRGWARLEHRGPRVRCLPAASSGTAPCPLAPPAQPRPCPVPLVLAPPPGDRQGRQGH